MRACCPCARSPSWRAGGATTCPNRRSRRPRRSWTPCGLGARQRCVNTPSGSATSDRKGGRGPGWGRGRRCFTTARREALARLPAGDRARLERVAERIRGFAEAQYRALCPVAVSVPGGVAEHQIAPVERAGCYAPGGRYPLPSSVLMTAVTARVAGVRDIWVASPKPQGLTLAAAAIAGADGVLAAGGAQAIAALAYGAGPIAPRDVIVGPGNRYVAAAKQLVSEAVAIDLLAGPSELTILADDTADPD